MDIKVVEIFPTNPLELKIESAKAIWFVNALRKSILRKF